MAIGGISQSQDSGYVGHYWSPWHPGGEQAGEKRQIRCELCPRYCRIPDGERGFCFVRENRGGQLLLSTYGYATGLAVDPIEKKPLNHFYPGSRVLSFGTAGCNLACKFCQNWHMSHSKQVHAFSQRAMPQEIAEMARRNNCPSVAYTYNDPVVFHEYVVDTAKACHEQGIANVAVTAGYINQGARKEFFDHMDAVNMDLKSFRERFYRSLTGGHIKPVLKSLEYVAHETRAWLEITTLVIPGYNDSRQEIRELASWIVGHLGSEVPLHLTAFSPSGEMTQVPRTPVQTLFEARQVAQDEGLDYVYTGNILSPETSHSYCPHCGALVIERNYYQTQIHALDKKGHCQKCGYKIAGRF